MKCSDARKAMLTAERVELQAHPRIGSALARHLGDCATCRAIARRLEDDITMLASALDARGVVVAPVRSSFRWSFRRAAALAALPLAAAMAGIALMRRDVATPITDPASKSYRIAANVVSVDVERGQTATVIRTRDPKVTVVWLSPGETP